MTVFSANDKKISEHKFCQAVSQLDFAPESPAKSKVRALELLRNFMLYCMDISHA